MSASSPKQSTLRRIKALEEQVSGLVKQNKEMKLALNTMNKKIEDSCGEVHRMGWIEFQIEAIKRLMSKNEDGYPMDEVWIVPTKGGRTVRLES